MRNAFAIVSLLLTVACFVLQAGQLHAGSPLLFVCAAVFAMISVALSRRFVRAIGIVLMFLAILGASYEFHRLVEFKAGSKRAAVFADAATNLYGKIHDYCVAHPSESFVSLEDYVSRGVLTPEDVAFLHDAEVTCYPFLPNGTDGDTLIEIWQGRRRTLISQVGGVFSYNASKITYLGSSPGPSKEFIDTVNRQYPGTIPISTPTNK
jgi:hypothetical protein